MLYKCQKDSFLKEFTTNIVSCEPASLLWQPSAANHNQHLEGFNVVCEDTIFYAEGGGQPCDYGTMNGKPVRNVIHRNTEVVHFVEASEPFAKGDRVEQCLDWERRLDHMQQHSGQHLLTELFDELLNYDTISWWMGKETSFIELNSTQLLTDENLRLIENKANTIIMEGRSVSVNLMDTNDLQKNNVRAHRNLPDHVCGTKVRVVCVEGQRPNMCGGTHVTNLYQLQSVKLLHCEKSKKGIHIYFLIGQRVLKYLDECYRREQQLTAALKGGPKQHLELLTKLHSKFKFVTKAYQNVLKDFARLKAEELNKMDKSLPKYYTIHRQDGIETDFITSFLRNAPTEVSLYFITVSDIPTSNKPAKGHMVLKGAPDLLQYFTPKFLQILDGKGNIKNDISQGKFNNVSGIEECERILREYFQAN